MKQNYHLPKGKESKGVPFTPFTSFVHLLPQSPLYLQISQLASVI